MIWQRLAISCLLALSCALLAVQVGALWPRGEADPVAPVAAPAEVRSIPLAAVGDYRDHFSATPEQRQRLVRLEGRLENRPEDLEARLMRGLLLFERGDLNAAIAQLRTLTEQAPRFQLAHLVLGDLLLARFGQLDTLGAAAQATNLDVDKERLAHLQHEARVRLQGYLLLTGDDRVPRTLMALGVTTEYALVVDKSRHRLYVFRNQGGDLPPRLVDNFYVVLGQKRGDKAREGDLRTPDGVYHITSYLTDEQLPPLYGNGAFPVNYPNEWDRRQAKTGNGIWLHGTEKSLYSRPPLDSEGCIVLTNDELERVGAYVTTGRTPVIISEQLDWISKQQWLERNSEIQAALESWRQSWEEADLDSYLDHYADDFWTRGHDLDSWANYKKRVFAGKTFQRINLRQISLLGYPRQSNQRPMVVATFAQQYRSNNYNGDMFKKLYLVKEAGRWQVLYEGRL